jgi:hypothetical protein
MRTDHYTVNINRRGVRVYHADDPENGDITYGEMLALIAALTRQLPQYKLERMAIECTDAPDEEQPEWGGSR